MEKMKALAVLIALVFCAACAAAPKPAGPACVPAVNLQKYKPKADNFLILLDSSESMAGYHAGTQKLALAKDMLACMNQCMQNVKVNGGLRTYGRGYYLFSISQTNLIYGMEPYRPEGMREALRKVNLASGNSPMVKALNKAKEDLKAVGGRTALILVTDGKPTDGDPIAAAEEMKRAMGDNLCIYAVQIGVEPLSRQMLEEIVEVGRCGFLTNADNILDCAAMTDFVERVFFEKCTDTDGDGVCDEVDKCPRTPRGVKADKHGCWSMILFATDEIAIKESARPALNDMAGMLSAPDNKNATLIIKGHTDSTGSEPYNKELSGRRAQAVKQYLMNRGIEGSRLETRGYGSAFPVAGNDSASGRAQNRRVEFELRR